MRQLILLTIVLAFNGCLLAVEKPESKSSAPPGAIQLIEGFRHKQHRGIDTEVGRIWKEGGLEIRYDIGALAGDYASQIKGPDREWSIKQVVNGSPVEIVKEKNGNVYVTFTLDGANFYGKVANEQELAAFLSITLTYPAVADAK